MGRVPEERNFLRFFVSSCLLFSFYFPFFVSSSVLLIGDVSWFCPTFCGLSAVVLAQ